MRTELDVQAGPPVVTAAVRKGSGTRARRRRPTIVLVDDDADLRFISVVVLRAAGYEILECADLAEAFAALQACIPDIVLLDRDLPDGSGLEVARWMRGRPSYDGVRVIGLSGRTSARDVEAALDAGCDAFVAKPCAPATLISEIAAMSLARPPR
jgi:two-component system, cell cycle response regulator DivK